MKTVEIQIENKETGIESESMNLVNEGEKRESKFKMSFEGAIAERFNEIHQELKTRGIDPKKLTALVTDEIALKSQGFWDKWLEEITPIQFYLRVIQSDAEQEARLAKVLKQMYLGKLKNAQGKED